jgi:gp16 family phage-associated protein
MANPGVSNPAHLGERALAARQRFADNGTNISAWASERGFNPRLVHQILRGDRPCVRGKSHKIAVALGIKGQPAELASAPAPVAVSA